MNNTTKQKLWLKNSSITPPLYLFTSCSFMPACYLRAKVCVFRVAPQVARSIWKKSPIFLGAFCFSPGTNRCYCSVRQRLRVCKHEFRKAHVNSTFVETLQRPRTSTISVERGFVVFFTLVQVQHDKVPLFTHWKYVHTILFLLMERAPFYSKEKFFSY